MLFIQHSCTHTKPTLSTTEVTGILLFWLSYNGPQTIRFWWNCAKWYVLSQRNTLRNIGSPAYAVGRIEMPHIGLILRSTVQMSFFFVSKVLCWCIACEEMKKTIFCAEKDDLLNSFFLKNWWNCTAHSNLLFQRQNQFNMKITEHHPVKGIVSTMS